MKTAKFAVISVESFYLGTSRVPVSNKVKKVDTVCHGKTRKTGRT